MDKVAAALPQRMRTFLDRLPAVLDVKATPLKKRDESRHRKHIASLLTAVLEHRQVKMQYYSASSKQTKDYLVEPYRLAYAQGGMYLLAECHTARHDSTADFAVVSTHLVALGASRKAVSHRMKANPQNAVTWS